MVQRTFIPGSQWLYFKIYTGAKTADDLLTRTILPCVENLHVGKLIDKYFFIRYADPDFHIRLRLHISDLKEYTQIFGEFMRYFQSEVDNGRVSKVLCDTYFRELERYGAETIELIEALFYIDSKVIMHLLTRIFSLSSESKDMTRWQISLLLLDDVLTAFGYGLPDKVRITQQMTESYKREFEFTTHAYTKQLNDKFRLYRRDIEDVLATRSEFATFEDLLQPRKAFMSAVGGRINEIRATGATIPSADALLISIQHMTMNRWFRARNRQYELVIYDFLNRYYESVQARSKHAMKDII